MLQLCYISDSQLTCLLRQSCCCLTCLWPAVQVGTMLTTLLPIWEAREYLFIIIAWLTSDKQGTPGRPSAFESGEMKRAQSAIPLKEVAPV